MKNYRPLLFQEMDVRLPGLRVRRLQLNRHLPEVDLLARHAHPFAQILCYLSGRGAMLADGRLHQIGPASIVFLPPRCEHAFHETTGRRPLCLVLDLDWDQAQKGGVTPGRLTLSDAGNIRRELSDLIRLSDPHSPDCRLVVASGVMRILDVLLRGLHLLPPRQREASPIVRQFDRLVRDSDTPLPDVAGLAEKMGYQVDYLNRLFKRATGQTLREYRDARQIEKAQRLLRTHPQIRQVCDAMGFLDQNYFARWFKKHTGQQPRAFQKRAGA